MRVSSSRSLKKSLLIRTPDSRTMGIFKRNTMQVFLNSTIIPFRWLRTCFRCFYCYEMFEDADSLKGHQEIHTLQDKHDTMEVFCENFVTVDVSKIVCKLCSNEYENILQLIDHLITVHDIEFDQGVGISMAPVDLDRGPKCVFCSIAFNNYNSLIVHMNRHHKSCYKSVCPTCQKCFTSTKDYCDHIQKQIFGDRIKCTQCDEYITVDILRSHMLEVHKLKYKCLVCLEYFPSHYKRSNHMADNHDRRKRIKCTHCPRSFIFRSFLQRHMKESHLKEKNVVCEVCGWRTYWKTQLDNHMARHDTVRHVACPACDKSFKTKTYMRKHYIKIHEVHDTHE